MNNTFVIFVNSPIEGRPTSTQAMVELRIIETDSIEYRPYIINSKRAKEIGAALISAANYIDKSGFKCVRIE